jgi:hypothetical protein
MGESAGGSTAALSGVILSQINYYKNYNVFYGFRNAVLYLNDYVVAVPTVTPIPERVEDQRRYAYINYMTECASGRLPAPSFGGSSRWPQAQEIVSTVTSNLSSPLDRFEHDRYGISNDDRNKLDLISSRVTMAYEKGISDMRRFIADYANYPQVIPWWGAPVDYNAEAERVIFWPVLSSEHQGVLVHSGAAAGLPAAYYCPQPSSGPPAIQIGIEPSNLFCAVCDSRASIAKLVDGEKFPRSCEIDGKRVGFDLNKKPY